MTEKYDEVLVNDIAHVLAGHYVKYPTELTGASKDLVRLKSLIHPNSKERIEEVAKIFERYKSESTIQLVMFVRMFTRENICITIPAYPEFKDLVVDSGDLVREARVLSEKLEWK